MYYNKTNLIIRDALNRKNLPLWKLADILGKSLSSITNMMRQELPEEEQNRIVALIDDAESEVK